MKSPLLIVLVAAVLVTVGTLAVMNNACKSSQHPWCAPTSSSRHHHIKTGWVPAIDPAPLAESHAVIDFDQIADATR
jgi:hypothetical protein